MLISSKCELGALSIAAIFLHIFPSHFLLYFLSPFCTQLSAHLLRLWLGLARGKFPTGNKPNFTAQTASSKGRLHAASPQLPSNGPQSLAWAVVLHIFRIQFFLCTQIEWKQRKHTNTRQFQPFARPNAPKCDRQPWGTGRNFGPKRKPTLNEL